MTDPLRPPMALLWPISACILYVAVAIVSRLRLPSRGERIVAVALVANVVAVAPIFLLGAANALTRTSLGVAIIVITAATTLAANGLRKEGVALAKELVAVPVAVFREALKQNAPVALVALATAGYGLFSMYAAYWAPTWRSFDSIWYHEPIVGFTIQNRGFAWVSVPVELEVVNANPRASEMLQVLFALYGGRRVVELPASLAFLGAGPALYALLGRVSSRVDQRVGFATAILLVPAFFIQLGTTYIDTHVFALLVAAWVFASTRELTRAHLWLVAVAMCLAVGAKATMYLPGGLTMAGVAARYAYERPSRARGAAESALALTGSLALAAHTLTRNWIHYRNPVFPIPLSVPSLGIDWAGLGKPFEDEAVLEPFADVWKNALAQPLGDGRYNYPFFVLPHTAREAASAYNYGYAVAYVLVPFGCVALLFLGMRLALSPALGLPAHRLRGSVLLLFAGVVAGAHWHTLHYLHLARYHGVLLVLLAAAIGAATEALGATRWGAALSGGACLLAVVTLHLEKPRCYLLPTDVQDMAEVPYPDREVAPEHGAPTTLTGGRIRALDFGPGSIVAYTDGLQAIAPLWNDSYSNEVVYVREARAMLPALEASGAGHFVCGSNCWDHQDVRRAWRMVGPFFSFSTTTSLYARPAPSADSGGGLRVGRRLGYGGPP